LRTAVLTNAAFSKDQTVKLSPNPTSGTLTVVGKNITHIAITDMLGKQMNTADYKGLDTVNLNLDALSNRIYIINVTCDKETSAIKIIKQ